MAMKCDRWQIPLALLAALLCLGVIGRYLASPGKPKWEWIVCTDSVVREMLKGVPSAFVALVIGLIATYIAYRQYRVSHGKFKLDLFEKRHEVYVQTAAFLTRIAVSLQLLDGREIGLFRGVTAAAPFLFDADITDLLKEITDKASLPRERQKEVEAWAEDKLKTLSERFMPYMNLSAWR